MDGQLHYFAAGCLLYLAVGQSWEIGFDAVVEVYSTMGFTGTANGGVCRFYEKATPDKIFGCLAEPPEAKGSNGKPNIRMWIARNNYGLAEYRLICSAGKAEAVETIASEDAKYKNDFNQLPPNKLGVVATGNTRCAEMPNAGIYDDFDRANGICVFFERRVGKYCMTAPLANSKEVFTVQVPHKGMFITPMLACSTTEAKHFEPDFEADKTSEQLFKAYFGSKQLQEKKNQPYGTLKYDYKTCDFTKK